MQLVAVDIGNSSTKVAVQDLDEDNDVRWFSLITLRGDDPIQLDLSDIPAFWSVCSVNQQRFDSLNEWIAQHRPLDRVHLIVQDEIGIRSNVKSPGQVGRDRLVAAWMALQLSDEQGPIVVIDAGTAVTIDLVDSKGVFQGGVIFPVASSNLRCLPSAAPALPDLSDIRFADQFDNSADQIIGKETQAAILSGVYRSQILAISELAKMIGESTLEKYTVYATGGGIPAIDQYLPDNWQLVPDLVLRSAKAIGQRLLSKKMAEK